VAQQKGTMMERRTVTEVKEVIVSLLKATSRPGMDDLLEYLEVAGFYTSPASTRFHGCYEGGLALHSLGVYEILWKWYEQGGLNQAATPNSRPLQVTVDNITIATLLHDVCKIGCYSGIHAPYKWIRQEVKGHALVSLLRIAKHIKIAPIEEMMIKYHMGYYGLIEYDVRAGEYHLTNQNPDASKEERYGNSLRNAMWHNPIVKYMYFADEIAALMERQDEA
jgi:hypothetical protein